MSSWGGICICGAGCKHETGCRGYVREHEMDMTTSATIASGIAPATIYSGSEGTNKGPAVENKSTEGNGDPCSY